MRQRNGIVLSVDYHDKNFVARWWDSQTGKQQVLKRETSRQTIRRLASTAARQAGPEGRVVWVMESTTGWPRVAEALGGDAELVLANVLQMPRAPKARRRKTDTIDTKRQLREYLTGQLPVAFQPPRPLREARRLVALRESLVARRTALSNWLDRYRAHETWEAPRSPCTEVGWTWWRTFAGTRPRRDRFVLETKLDELAHVQRLLARTEAEVLALYACWPDAQRVDAIFGIAEVSAVSLLARIGPVERFGSAEALIAFAGLAPGVRESDGTRRDGRIGGGGTDKHLRHYVIEATLWAREIPRYRVAYDRVRRRRGKKIGRLVVGRMLLRSLYKMLKEGVAFDPAVPVQAGVAVDTDNGQAVSSASW